MSKNGSTIFVAFSSATRSEPNNCTDSGRSFSENSKNPEKSISLKINEIEAGGFINAIENYCDFSAVHSFQDNKTSISFKPYTKKDGTEAFSFGVTRNSSNKFGIGVEMSEAYGLLEFCKFFLSELYICRLQNNLKQRKLTDLRSSGV